MSLKSLSTTIVESEQLVNYKFKHILIYVVVFIMFDQLRYSTLPDC